MTTEKSTASLQERIREEAGRRHALLTAQQDGAWSPEEEARWLWLAGRERRALDTWVFVVREALGRGRFQDAAAILDRALHVAPGSQELLAAARALARRHPDVTFNHGPPDPEPFAVIPVVSALVTAAIFEDLGLDDAARGVLARAAEAAQMGNDRIGFAEVCARLVQLGTERVDLVVQHARHMIEDERLEEAAEVLAFALEVVPDSYEVRELLSDTYLRLGMDAEARAVAPEPRWRRFLRRGRKPG